MLNTIFAQADISLLRLIHHNRIVLLDPVLYYFSLITTYISIGIILTLFIISIKKKSARLRMIFYKMLAVFMLAALVSFTMKNIFDRERPFRIYPDIEKLSQAGSSSFPSGHTLEVFAVVVALSTLLPRRRVYIPLYIWACVVAYSRMALGVHYPSDVIGGMFTGALIGLLVPLGIDKIQKIN